jgi:ATP-dependent Clp protease ATP-binding subunit ClpA
MLKDMADALSERNIRFTYTDKACKLIAKESFSKKFGARNMRRYIQTQIEDKLAHAIIFEIKGTIIGASVDVKNGKLVVDCI